MQLIVDAHLDLAMNAMEWNRDLRQPLGLIRESEKRLKDKPDRGNNTVTFDELRRGNVGLVVATLIARSVPPESPLPGWNSPEQAWAQTQAQLAWYRAMEQCGDLRQIADRASLARHLVEWEASTSDRKPVGYVLSLEGADSILTAKHLEPAWVQGLRALGPAHYGPGRYAFGTDSDGPMNVHGIGLLKEMERLGMILDVTHLSDASLRSALDHFTGPVWASHSNCRSLVNHNRQFSDDQLKELFQRGAVIGAAFDAWMLVPGWVRGKSKPLESGCSLASVVDHIDHVCQLAGDSLHSAVGSDLDGAFGKEQCPHDLESIADLQKLPSLLARRGYSSSDIENILSRNWLRFLEEALP
jgi:membrane dipeptidase